MCIRDRGCRPAQRCRRGSGPRDPAGLGRRTPRCGLRPFRRVRRCPAGRGGGARDGRQACARLAGDSRGRGLPRPAGSRSTGRPSAGWAPHRDHVGALRGGRGASDPAPAVERLRLAPHPTAPRASRNFVTRTLLDWGLGRVISSASLVVSELVTTSTMYAGTDIDLSVAWNAGALRLTVRDNSPTLPRQRHSAPDLHGRGFTIVTGLSRAFGVLPAAVGGKVVWTALDAPRPRPSTGPRRPEPATKESPIFTDARGVAGGRRARSR